MLTAFYLGVLIKFTYIVYLVLDVVKCFIMSNIF